MAKQFHMKGFILRLLDQKDEGMWDYEIADETLSEYGYQGAYWKGEVRLALTDLYSGGLVEDLEDKIDDGTHFKADKLLVKYKLTAFGRERTKQTGIL
jgi:hypothetical protein